jgi:hypothetical protein
LRQVRLAHRLPRRDENFPDFVPAIVHSAQIHH